MPQISILTHILLIAYRFRIFLVECSPSDQLILLILIRYVSNLDQISFDMESCLSIRWYCILVFVSKKFDRNILHFLCASKYHALAHAPDATLHIRLSHYLKIIAATVKATGVPWLESRTHNHTKTKWAETSNVRANSKQRAQSYTIHIVFHSSILRCSIIRCCDKCLVEITSVQNSKQMRLFWICLIERGKKEQVNEWERET